MAVTFVWQKRVAPARADHWTARLAAAGVDLARLVVIETPRAVRLEICGADAAEAGGFAARFGGTIREVPDADWQTPAPAATAARPLRIGRRLLVTGAEDAATLVALRAGHPGRAVLSIPAAMAFGTGEHATTAMCLRLLDGVARGLPPAGWDALDLGSGSGILALAARLLGAGTVLGLENDPHAVRTARENARRHDGGGLGPPLVRFQRADLRRWSAAGRTWPVVTANLFSTLLVALLPNVIFPALAPGGQLIASGVLAGEQEAEVATALRLVGLTLVETRRRGKWVAFRVGKPGQWLVNRRSKVGQSQESQGRLLDSVPTNPCPAPTKHARNASTALETKRSENSFLWRCPARPPLGRSSHRRSRIGR